MQKRLLNYLSITLLAFNSFWFLSGCGKKEELKPVDTEFSAPGLANKTVTSNAVGEIWYKGNLHTHANNDSDADSDPLTVARWYRDHDAVMMYGPK